MGGDLRDHTYTEVGIRNNPTPTHCLDDGLYETVGVREGEVAAKAACAPPSTSASTPASVRAAQSPSAQVSGNRNGNVSSYTQHQHNNSTTPHARPSSSRAADNTETIFIKLMRKS